MTRRSSRGFTLVEVLVALMVVAIGLAALMAAVSGAARTSGYLRDKTLAEWIALNRLTEVRLTVNKLGQNTDTGQLDFANRTWHYDTRYFDTSVASMKRVVVRVWLGDAKTKSNPVAEYSSFLGSALATPGNSNAVDWTQGTTATPCAPTPSVGTSPVPPLGPLGSTSPGAPPCTPSGIPAPGASNGASATTPPASPGPVTPR